MLNYFTEMALEFDQLFRTAVGLRETRLLCQFHPVRVHDDGIANNTYSHTHKFSLFLPSKSVFHFPPFVEISQILVIAGSTRSRFSAIPTLFAFSLFSPKFEGENIFPHSQLVVYSERIFTSAVKTLCTFSSQSIKPTF